MTKIQKPKMQQLADNITQKFLEMSETGMMLGRDSDGDTVQVPVSGTMWSAMMQWCKTCGVTASRENVESVYEQASRLGKSIKINGA